LQPRGPYHLGGYCFGGNVAFEMARQLRDQGEQISWLALINCAPPDGKYTRFRFKPKTCLKFLKNLGYWADYFRRLEPRQRSHMLFWKIKALKKRLLRRFVSSSIEVEEIVDLSAQPEDRRKLWQTHVRALLAHRTSPYAGEVTLFRTRGHPLICSFDDDFGWQEFASGGALVKMVPGAHESALDEPHVQTLGKIMQEHLQEVQNTKLRKDKP
jgi:thioesterase domain-containing protein